LLQGLDPLLKFTDLEGSHRDQQQASKRAASLWRVSLGTGFVHHLLKDLLN
jgi:hypothetical protein